MKNTPPDTLFNLFKANLRNYITNKLQDSHLKELLKGSSTFFTFKLFGLVTATVGQFISAISGSVESILQMTGKHKAFQNIILLAAIINIILNIILIPKYGIVGAALASMVSVVFWSISAMLFIKSKLNITTIYFPLMKKNER